MANLILTWEKINSWGGATYNTDVKRCPTKAEVVAKGLLIPYTASNNLLIYNVSRSIYSNITITSIKVSDIPASGGTITSGTVTYTQSITTYNYLNGTSTGTITSGATIKWSGSASGSNLSTTETPRTAKGTLTVTVTLNGKSASASVTVYQLANQIIKINRSNIHISSPVTGTPLGGFIFTDSDRDGYYDSGEPCWEYSSPMLLLAHELVENLDIYYTSGAIWYKFGVSIPFSSVSSWKMTYSGQIPLYFKTGTFGSWQVEAAWVYIYNNENATVSLLLNHIKYDLGVINVGDKVTGSYTLTAVYNGQTYTYTKNDCYIERTS